MRCSISRSEGQAVATNSTRSPREDARRCAKALLPLDAPPRMRMERRADSVRIISPKRGGERVPWAKHSLAPPLLSRILGAQWPGETRHTCLIYTMNQGRGFFMVVGKSDESFCRSD